MWLHSAIQPLCFRYDIATNAANVILNQRVQAIWGGLLNLVDYQFVPADQSNV